jgi:uncharacterized protein DUF3570
MRLQLSALAALLMILGSVSVVGADRAFKGGKVDMKPPTDVPGGLTIKASTEVTGYGDTDHVSVVSPSIAGVVADEVAGWSLSGHYLVDVVSAASVDIVSTASGKWREIRHAGSAEGSFKFEDASLGASAVVSSEPDYLSIAGGATLTVDLLEKNVTPYVGFSYGQDQVGRTGLPRDLWRTKQTTSGRIGVTFVVDRFTIASLQGDATEEAGYLAKPYRYVPLFAPGEGGQLGPGASVTEVNATRVPERAAEQLPGKRDRFALTGRIGHRYSQSTLRLDERAYVDTWNLFASTTDFRFMFDVGRRLTLWPHLRFHVQNQAVFWQRTYELVPSVEGALGVPTLRTGDRELSPLYAGTAGLGARFTLVDSRRAPWFIVFEVDGSYTRYLDALYISDRTAVFSTLAVEAQF